MRLLGLATTHAADELEPADLIAPDLTHVAVRVVGDKLEVQLR
jgi:hypothetical protein